MFSLNLPAPYTKKTIPQTFYKVATAEDFPETTTVKYIPASVHLDGLEDNNYYSGVKAPEKATVPTKKIFESIQSLFERFAKAYTAGQPLSPEDYKWDIYAELGIPEFSLFQRGGKQDNIHFVLTEILKSFNQNKLIQDAYGNETSPSPIDFSDGTQQYQVAFTMDPPEDPLNNNLPGVIFSETTGHDETYKIHLNPKHQYAFYTICKLFTLLRTSAFAGRGKITAKLLFNYRVSNLTENDTEQLSANGGIVPVIVFYCNNDRNQVKKILEQMVKSFSSDIAVIGSLVPEYPFRVLPFNVRLNSLISYAQGDRTDKLKARMKFQQTKRHDYKTPNWVLDMMKKCSTETINQSMRFLGKNVCSEPVKSMILDPTCEDDICWLTAYPEDMLDPRSIRYLELEANSTASTPPANTSHDIETNVAEQKTQPMEGGRRTRRSKKTRRLGRFKGRKSRRQRGGVPQDMYTFLFVIAEGPLLGLPVFLAVNIASNKEPKESLLMSMLMGSQFSPNTENGDILLRFRGGRPNIYKYQGMLFKQKAPIVPFKVTEVSTDFAAELQKEYKLQFIKSKTISLKQDTNTTVPE